jgi:hypothetical protein
MIQVKPKILYKKEIIRNNIKEINLYQPILNTKKYNTHTYLPNGNVCFFEKLDQQINQPRCLILNYQKNNKKHIMDSSESDNDL